MSVKVAVIGPRDLVDKIVTEGGDYKLLELTPYYYQSETEAVRIVNSLAKDTDLVLFTGPIPYYMTRGTVGRDIPMIYVSYSGSAFYKALFYYLEQRHWARGQKIRFSLDTIHSKTVKEIMEELEITDYELYDRDSEENLSTEELVSFHLGLYRKGKIDFVITCLTSAYDAIRSQGLPCYRVVPTLSSIHEALRFTTLEGRNLLSKEAQLCVGIVKIMNRREIKNYIPSEYEQKRMNLVLTELFVNFCEEIKASMKVENNDEYIFYATRGAIENVTNYYRHMPLMRDIEEHLSYKVCIGLGYGYFASEAEKNSREALDRAIAYDQNTCFVIFEDGKIRGPIGFSQEIEYYPHSLQSAVVEQAQHSNVSIMTLNRIFGIVKQKGENLTANDIAENLNITLRSARRILSNLEKSGVAVPVGEWQPSSRGRPRQIFHIEV